MTIYAGTNGFLDEFPVDTIGKYEKNLIGFVEQKHPDIIKDIESKKIISEELEEKIQQVLKIFSEKFQGLLDQ